MKIHLHRVRRNLNYELDQSSPQSLISDGINGTQHEKTQVLAAAPPINPSLPRKVFDSPTSYQHTIGVTHLDSPTRGNPCGGRALEATGDYQGVFD